MRSIAKVLPSTEHVPGSRYSYRRIRLRRRNRYICMKCSLFIIIIYINEQRFPHSKPTTNVRNESNEITIFPYKRSNKQSSSLCEKRHHNSTALQPLEWRKVLLKNHESLWKHQEEPESVGIGSGLRLPLPCRYYPACRGRRWNFLDG